MNEKELDELQTKLERFLTFPTVYMFKFIIETDLKKLAQIENLFNDKSFIQLRNSSRDHYLSITVKMPADNIHEIMEIYRKASAIQGIMFL
ncbi:MAG: DUF493 domain-containing protein [Bacteroidia bacterium]|nr:DUF493 domain-containing protein [Bacteroidia bacterium]